MESAGCYRLPPQGTLEFLEDSHALLDDDPYNRTEPVRKCGSQVAVAFCASGTTLSQYFAQENQQMGQETSCFPSGQHPDNRQESSSIHS